MSGLSLMDQINAMQVAAATTSASASAKSAELNKEIVKVRRKSRDLEEDFFGMPSEEAADIKKTFREFDADKSGGISQSELKDAIAKLKSTVMPPDRVLRKMIQFYSRKDFMDGKELDEKAFHELIKAVKDGSFNKKIAEEDETLNQLFEQIDVDSSKSISHTELRAALDKVPKVQRANYAVHWERMLGYADKETAEGKEFTFDAFRLLADDIEAGKFE